MVFIPAEPLPLAEDATYFSPPQAEFLGVVETFGPQIALQAAVGGVLGGRRRSFGRFRGFWAPKSAAGEKFWGVFEAFGHKQSKFVKILLVIPLPNTTAWKSK